MTVRELSVFRGYISPEKPLVQANHPVLLGFMGVFWKSGFGGFSLMSICCGVWLDGID
jgi:hypothetical protein